MPLLGLLISAALPAPATAADMWWRDPERGCGKIEDWRRTNRIQDLPGCEGTLEKGAPQGEIAMHDAKKLLREAERQLDGGQSGEVEGKIAQAIEIMNKAPSDPRVNWARVQYKVAVDVLKAKLALAPRLAKLRTSYKAVVDAQGKADPKTLASAVEACVAAFKEAEGAGGNLALQFELTPGKPRPLRDDLAECEAAKGKPADTATAGGTTATPAGTGTGTGDSGTTASKPAGDGGKPAAAAAAAGSDGGVPRAKWEKKLKGDRKKVFASHADAFPAFEGEPGPKGAAKAAEWRYGSEVIKFKGNKLLKE